jgi:hypothetical protein
MSYKRSETTLEIPLQPAAPLTPKDKKPMLGIGWSGEGIVDTHIVHPDPIRQCKDSVRMMVATIKALVSPKSSVGIDQLSGPISIAKAKFDLLNTDVNGWRPPSTPTASCSRSPAPVRPGSPAWFRARAAWPFPATGSS